MLGFDGRCTAMFRPYECTKVSLRSYRCQSKFVQPEERPVYIVIICMLCECYLSALRQWGADANTSSGVKSLPNCVFLFVLLCLCLKMHDGVTIVAVRTSMNSGDARTQQDITDTTMR